MLLSDDFYRNGSLACFDDCPVGDRDIMNDEHDYACGVPACRKHADCEGCPKCDPTDYDAQPQGLGLEEWEHPVWAESQRVARWRMEEKSAKYTSAVVHIARPWGMDRGGDYRLYASDETMSVRRQYFDARGGREAAALSRLAKNVWRWACDRYDTHTQAAEFFRWWAERNRPAWAK